MPIVAVQRHVAGVRHREVVAHLASGQHLGVAPLGDDHTQVGGLVVVAYLDNLAGILQGFIKCRMILLI